MRWLPDKFIVLFLEVVTDLYMAVIVGCSSKNISTSLNPTLPLDKTNGYKKLKLGEHE